MNDYNSDSTASEMSRSSRLLIKILRHSCLSYNLYPDAEGYIEIDKIQEKVEALRHLTLENIQTIVDTDDKSRFSLKCDDEIMGHWYIRANQGHSKEVGDYIESAKCMTPLTVPIDGVFHGTYTHLQSAIAEKGLLPMGRKHIHLAKSATAVSGQRKDCTLHVDIDMAAAMRDGIPFYESANGVILTEGPLLPKYLTFTPLQKSDS